MEPENEDLVEEYVQDFVFDHLEDVTVKLENSHQILDTETWLQQEDSSSKMCRTQWNDRKIPSPPLETTYGLQPLMVNMSLVNDPGTPPDTPPSHSPISCRPPGIMDEMMWFPQSMHLEAQPLDLRPLHCMGGDLDWERREYIPSGMIHETNNHHGVLKRPQSVCSTSSAPSSRPNKERREYSSCWENIIDDKLLLDLSIKDLNKRLHGYPREEITKLKLIRRTLKNRGYAHNCRSKRQQVKQDLEQKNKSLQRELHRLKSELSRVAQEKDLLKQRLQLGTCVGMDNGFSSLNSSINSSFNNLTSDGQSSPEFYL